MNRRYKEKANMNAKIEQEEPAPWPGPREQDE